MPVENTGGVIAGLNVLWPEDDEIKSEGDNHLRMLKQLLKQQFPGANGNGFEKTITANVDELNYLAGVTSNIQQQIDGLKFPAGTRMVFVQASVPVGWTIDATLNDRVIRVMSSSGGSTGGSWTITGLSSSVHVHSVNLATGKSNGPDSSAGSASKDYSESDHTHNVTGNTENSTPSNVTSDGAWRPAYVDVVIGVRDAD